MNNIKLNCIPVLKDNYIWIIIDIIYNKAIVFDPGEYQNTANFLKINNLTLIAIMLTHHHNDHVDGVEKLCVNNPNVLVYGPKETYNQGITNIVQDGDIINLMKHKFYIISTPGHTLDHISYYIPPYIFCGDTIFSGGCGRLIEGEAKQMYESLNKINKLPGQTIICCAHEYTLSNMEFAISILPHDLNIINYYKQVKQFSLYKKSSLPTTLYKERKVNVFLRTQEQYLLNNLKIKNNSYNPWDVFAILRQKKDNFKL